MTFHAPQSSARLVTIIARRMIFNKSAIIAIGAIASTTVVFAGRDVHTDVASLSTNQVRIASAAPFAIPRALGRPQHSDLLIDPDPLHDTISAFGAPARPKNSASQDFEPETAALAPGALAPAKQQVWDPELEGLEAPTPDWGTLDTMLGPRFPALGPVPLTPSTPLIEAGDTAPEITDMETGPRLRTFSAKDGEALEALLKRAGVGDEDRRATLIALRADTSDDGLAEGDKIDLAFARDEDSLVGIRLRQDDDLPPLELRWDGETAPLWASLTMTDAETAATAPTPITAATKTESLTKPAFSMDGANTALFTGEIKSSLWGATDKAGLRAGDAKRMVDMFRYIVDFERDLRKGDSFEALYEKDADGSLGDILYAKLTNRGSEIALYLGSDEFGENGYFDASGKTNLRSIMRTPVAGARVSSHFGMRRHPILGYDKMHRGVDFSAPTGTPVFATGNGIVDYVGRRGSYGKYIRIRHNGTFKTAYAHLSRYAANLTSGSRVRQGEVIGYVGSTGRSTGPHLHFEILQDGARVNPMQVADFGPEKVLAGAELSRFKANLAKIEVALGLMREGPRVASAEQ